MNGQTAFEAFRAAWLERWESRASSTVPEWETLSPSDVRAWEAVARAVTPHGERQAAMEMRQEVKELRQEIDNAAFRANLAETRLSVSRNSLQQEISRNAVLVEQVERLDLRLKELKAEASIAPRAARQTCQRSSVRHIYFLQPEEIFRQASDPTEEAFIFAENEEQREAIALALESPPDAELMPYTQSSVSTRVHWPTHKI
jgi:hypothetical protein